jgi:hypothetical protein
MHCHPHVAYEMLRMIMPWTKHKCPCVILFKTFPTKMDLCDGGGHHLGHEFKYLENSI